MTPLNEIQKMLQPEIDDDGCTINPSQTTLIRCVRLLIEHVQHLSERRNDNLILNNPVHDSVMTETPPIKKYVMDVTLSWEERYKKLEEHHIKEVSWFERQLCFLRGSFKKI